MKVRWFMRRTRTPYELYAGENGGAIFIEAEHFSLEQHFKCRKSNGLAHGVTDKDTALSYELRRDTNILELLYEREGVMLDHSFVLKRPG